MWSYVVIMIVVMVRGGGGGGGEVKGHQGQAQCMDAPARPYLVSDLLQDSRRYLRVFRQFPQTLDSTGRTQS